MSHHTSRSSAGQPARRQLGLATRLAVSLLVILHFTAVFSAPLASSILTAVGRLPPEAQPKRPPTLRVHRFFRPYLDLAYLNHGYGFFAPDPGPSHLIRYRVELANGHQIRGFFPNLKQQWPRLRYHRYFMLAEQVQPGSGKAYAMHLLKKYGAARVTVERIRHYLARPEEVLAGIPLNAAASYESLGTITVTSRDLGATRETSP